MKFTIRRNDIVEAIDRMFDVATKGIKTDFRLSHRIRMEVSDKLTLFATNGHLCAQCAIACDSIAEQGSAIIDAITGREIFRTIGGRGASDHKIEVELKDQSLRIRDTNSDHKKWAKMQTLSEADTFNIKVKKGASYSMPASELSSSINAVSKYKAALQFDQVYLMMCMHFLPNENRYICGDGMRFAVLSRKNKSNTKVQNVEQGDKWVMPCDQASIISSVLAPFGDTDVDITFPDKKSCFIQSKNMIMHLKSIPEIEYIEYDKHAYRFGEAISVIDVPRSEFLDALASVRAVRDKDSEQEGDFLSCKFVADASASLLQILVPTGKYQCEFECPIKYYKAKEDSFKSEYSWMFLNDLANATDHEYVRFYAIDPSGVMLAEPMDLIKPNDKGEFESDARIAVPCPAPINDKDSASLTFFFAAAINNDDE